MSDQLQSRAQQLREEFDQGFSRPAQERQHEGSALLAIRVGPDPYLLPLEGLSALRVDLPLLRLPTPVPAFLGLVGVRSGLVPVYSLRALLGYPEEGTQRWLAVAGEERVGFLFDAFEGHRQLMPHQRVPHAGAGAAAGLTPWAAEVAGLLRPLIDLRATLSFIRQRGPVSASRE